MVRLGGSMGFGSSLGKVIGSTSPIGGMATGQGLFGGLKNTLLGKKSEGSPEKYSQLNPEQLNALGLYNEGLNNLKNFNPEEQARVSILNQERMAQSGVADAERQARDLVAQRGLNKSAAGISAILGVGRGYNDKIQAIRAQQPLMQQQLEGERLNRLGSLSGGINAIYDTRMYTPAVAGGVRSGGILGPLLGAAGTAAGAYFGGPMGAAAGSQMGSALGSGFSQQQPANQYSQLGNSSRYGNYA